MIRSNNMKIYIDDFVEDLNYRRVILYIESVDVDKLYSKMCEDRVNHMNRFDGVLYNKLMFVENCDLQDVDTDHWDEYGNSLIYLLSAGYVVYPLWYDAVCNRYFVETELWDGKIE